MEISDRVRIRPAAKTEVVARDRAIPPGRFLIVEGQPEIRETLRGTLKLNGHEVIATEDGIQGLEAARNRADFIFCDVSTPNLGGHGMLSGIKQLAGVSDVPFVFLTANADRDQQRGGMASGADDHITKRFTQRDLLDAIAGRRWLSPV